MILVTSILYSVLFAYLIFSNVVMLSDDVWLKVTGKIRSSMNPFNKGCCLNCCYLLCGPSLPRWTLAVAHFILLGAVLTAWFWQCHLEAALLSLHTASTNACTTPARRVITYMFPCMCERVLWAGTNYQMVPTMSVHDAACSLQHSSGRGCTTDLSVSMLVCVYLYSWGGVGCWC